MCSGKRHKPASDEDEDTLASNAGASSGETAITFFTAGLQPPVLKPSELLAAAPAPSEPIPVYTGPTRTGAALIAAVAADAEKQTPKHHGKKTKVAAKPEAAAEPKATPKAAEKSAAKPAKPKTAAKTAAKPKDEKPKDSEKPKPAPKSTSEAKPANPQNAATPHS
jgi:D-alanyl-D-alanine carboxypeptidase